jgi:hypothetical protein
MPPGKRVFVMQTVIIIILVCAIPSACYAQAPAALDWDGKLRYHAQRSFGPSAFAVSSIKAGFLHMTDSPTEWGQGSSGYAKRAGSAVASSGIRGALALALDSTLHQDPRYFRSVSTGFWRRAGHAVRGTILTRTDSGGETLSTWRLGSAYGAAFLSNQWYPDRIHTMRHGLIGGSTRLGFDLAGNVTAEFWPDVKRKLTRR